MRLEYEYPTERLLLGGSYSNSELFARLHAGSDLAGVWSAADDQHYCGKWELRLYVDGELARPTTTRLTAAYQSTMLEARGVLIRKSCLVPEGVEHRQAVYLLLEIDNPTADPHTVVVTGDIRYPELAWLEFTKPPDIYQKQKRVISHAEDSLIVSKTIGRPNEVRLLASGAPLAEHFFDDQGVQFVVEPITLAAGSRHRMHFEMAFSNEGEQQARSHVNLDEAYLGQTMRCTRAWWEGYGGTATIITPSALLNRGLAWSKINMGRQRVRYPCGWGFTNDPPQDVMVVRDAAWFILGSDYLMPDFSMGMLDMISNTAVETNGKLTEYVLACEHPPYRYDYGLNVNDDTPLFVGALWHHVLATGETDLGRALFPLARAACEYLLTQRLGESGLVYCTSEESNMWGIAGWRNIIPGYQQNGAVTEINAETYWAFRCLAELATVLGLDHEAGRWQREAAELRARINEWLISPTTGLYIVNIDTAGVRHEELTGDMVFPLLFDVADDDVARRTLEALYQPEFWTPYGVRTVGKNQPGYDPEYGMRLTGGIWPNLTAWVAFASRRLFPEKMVEALLNIYRICESPVPRQFRNLVPGQFPECLHGENFESRGMSLSPWMPATYHWVGVEGLIGLTLGADGPAVNPNLPPGWHWSGVRNLPWQGGHLSLFVSEGVVYSTAPLQSRWPVEVFEEDVTHHFPEAEQADMIALRRGEELAIMVGAPEERLVELHLPAELAGRAQTVRLTLEPGTHSVIRL